MENVHGLVTVSPTTSGVPRSRRMEVRQPHFPPPRTVAPNLITPPASPKDDSPSMPPLSRPSQHSAPAPPPRSPLRPSPKSVSSFATLVELYSHKDTMDSSKFSELDSISGRRKSAMSLSASLDQCSFSGSDIQPESTTDPKPIIESSLLSSSEDKPLPIPPEDDSPLSSPTVTISMSLGASETSTVCNLPAAIAPVITKREHALKELLSSERAYASDLAFIRDVHIPMALGNAAPFHTPRPASPPRSSASSSRTMSTSSESSTNSILGPPMTRDDVRVIFGNIKELAMFADMFSDRLQEALGDVLTDGKGEDWVGVLFLEVIPQVGQMYKAYITKHPNAINHLNSLPQTPALANYLTQTQVLASSVTHSWDLPSLLIKPVQRLLKYSLLLSTILDQTSDNHGDKGNLRLARDQMEEVARGVNEGRRRIEVVQEVLSGKSDLGKQSALQKKLSIGKSPQVNIGRGKNVTDNQRGGLSKEGSNEEYTRVAHYEEVLKQYDTFVRNFAKDAVNWVKTVRSSHSHLQEWAKDFGATIGISKDHPSEAFSAFLEVIDQRLVVFCQELDDDISSVLLPEIANLLSMTKAPLRLLTAMHSLEPLHHSLLNINYARHRPTPSMLETSQNYLALRGQLAADLPRFLELFDRGAVICIRHFARCQTAFWAKVRYQWGQLWECLRMEGETNAGCAETLTLWWSRFMEVDDKISKLRILKREKLSIQARTPKFPGGAKAINDNSTSTEPPFARSTDLPNSFSGSSSRHRSVGSLDTVTFYRRYRTPSIESVPTFRSTHQDRSYSVNAEIAPRQKARSNTLPTSTSSPILNSTPLDIAKYRGTSTNTITAHEYKESIEARRDFRQVISHAQTQVQSKLQSSSVNLGRKISVTLRAPLRRSPSQKSITSQRSRASSSMRSHSPSHSLNGRSRSPSLGLNGSSAPPLPRHGSAGSGSGGSTSCNSSATRPISIEDEFDDDYDYADYDAARSALNDPIYEDNSGHQDTDYTIDGAPFDLREAVPPSLPSKYLVRVEHELTPPQDARYGGLPFATLKRDARFGVLQELGHPAQLSGLNVLEIDEAADDCLLIVKDERGVVSLALASYLEPVHIA